MDDSKRAKGSLSGFNLDSPSVLSKLINNDAMERPTGVINESLNNFNEDDPGIFRYLLDESLKDAWDRLLRIRASYVPVTPRDRCARCLPVIHHRCHVF